MKDMLRLAGIKYPMLMVILFALVISPISLINASRSKIKKRPIYSSTSLPKAYSIITALTAIMTVELQKVSLSLNKKI